MALTMTAMRVNVIDRTGVARPVQRVSPSIWRGVLYGIAFSAPIWAGLLLLAWAVTR